MNEQEYFYWYNFQATPEEKRVIDVIGQNEELFSDFVFGNGSKTQEFLKGQMKSADDPDAEWEDMMTGLPEELECFSATQCRIKVESLPEGLGQFNTQTKELTITPDYIECESVILHEMIHMYETMIESQMTFFRDIVFFVLYMDLKHRVPKLDEIITDHGNVLNQQGLNLIGGVHDILFLLKSLDLDLKKGYPLGTVFGYDMVEQLKQYN